MRGYSVRSLVILCALFFSALSIFPLSIAGSTTFKFSNRCSYEIWVGILNGTGSTPLSQTGFQLPPGNPSSLIAPSGWSGRFWGRSFCSTDSSGRFSCLTGDCGTGQVSCNGAGGSPPATLIEITLGADGQSDFYDVSLVDGYNLPVAVAPSSGSGDCRVAGCQWDLNGKCPTQLAVGGGPGGAVVACKSACEAFGDDRDCCKGAYGKPETCGPTDYSMLFKSACPAAYSYAYDDSSSTFTCVGPASYTLTFCPN